ncbi:hypothetical protein [Sphingomonas soli]|uniref:hypothetical protein n=1 Tax=Sphingomonas soli TaxID=266127 RepID=UPI00082CE725|nr:hypothetical protein [Sphingomonas soli]
MNMRSLTVALAAFSFAAVAMPASAHSSDPETNAPAAKAAKPPLSGRAKSVKLCRPESDAPGAKVVCKARGKWIREGRDPLGEY